MKESLLIWRMWQRFSIIEGAWGYLRLSFSGDGLARRILLMMKHLMISQLDRSHVTNLLRSPMEAQ